MKDLEKKQDYEGFMNHLWELDDKGIPHGISDITELAKKYNTPIPIGFDKHNKPIFKDDEFKLL